MYRPKPKGKLESREASNHRNRTSPGCLPIPKTELLVQRLSRENPKLELQGKEPNRSPLM